jgi:hypothetical protein
MATKPAEVVPFQAPDVKTDLKPIRIEATALVAEVAELPKIRTDAEYEAACAALVRLEKQVNKPAEAVRKHLNEPINEAKKRNDQLIADTLTVPGPDGESRYLPDVAKELRSQICDYQSRQYLKAARAAQQALDRLEAQDERAKAAGVELAALPFVPGVASPKRTTKTADGMVIVGAKLRFTIVDQAALPEMCTKTVPNEKAIEALLESGQDVPGVTAVLELGTTVR